MTILQNIESNYQTFSALSTISNRSALDKFSDVLYQKYCSFFAAKMYTTNVAWMGRHYLASKKIAMSALFYTQARHLMDQKMKNLSFYACYYALFNGLSANLIMNPHVDLSEARSISHGSLAKQIENLFVRPGVYKQQCVELLGDLRFSRELYSYHLPLSGRSSGTDDQLNIDGLFGRLSEILPSVLQASSLLSYLSYTAWEKKVGTPIDEYENYREPIDRFFHSIVHYEDATRTRLHYDDGDYMRLAYYITKIGQPMPIAWFITEKVLDELECGWAEEGGKGYEIELVGEYLSDTIGA